MAMKLERSSPSNAANRFSTLRPEGMTGFQRPKRSLLKIVPPSIRSVVSQAMCAHWDPHSKW